MVDKIKLKPKMCEYCHRKIQKIYIYNHKKTFTHNINDYKWGCDRCVMLRDGRFWTNLKQYQTSVTT